NPSSIRSSLTRAREDARGLRDRISLEMWETLNRAYLTLCFATERVLDEDGLHDYCVTAREASHLFLGIAHATLPRDLGWYFLLAGQHLERADNVLRLLQVRQRQGAGLEPVARGLENHRGMALLKSVSAYEAFRKRHHAALEGRRIAAPPLSPPPPPPPRGASATTSPRSIPPWEASSGSIPACRPRPRVGRAGSLRASSTSPAWRPSSTAASRGSRRCSRKSRRSP